MLKEAATVPALASVVAEIESAAAAGAALHKAELRRVKQLTQDLDDLLDDAEDGLDLGLYQDLKEQIADFLSQLPTLPNQEKAAKYLTKLERLQEEGQALEAEEADRLAGEAKEQERLAAMKAKLVRTSRLRLGSTEKA